MSASPLRVGLLDDHAVVRSGYRRLIELEADLAVLAEFASAEAAYAGLAGECALDVLVVDLSLPGMSGLELLRRLSLRCPGLRVLVFSMHAGAAIVQQCLDAGAAGFVTKSSAPEALVEALWQIARGERALSTDVVETLNERDTAPPVLTAREFDILQHLSAGRDVGDIAAILNLSAKTVANYQTEIRHKLGVRNAVELLRYARQQGVPAL